MNTSGMMSLNRTSLSALDEGLHATQLRCQCVVHLTSVSE